MKRVLLLLIGTVFVFGIAYAFIQQNNPSSPRFVTWDSLEPDTWASIWLIKTHINQNAQIDVVVTGDELGPGIPFGGVITESGV